MSSFVRAIPAYFPLVRTAPFAAPIGAAILASPIAPAYADGPKTGPIAMAQVGTPKPEAIEARIAGLHAKVQIAAAEDSKWNDVAKVHLDGLQSLTTAFKTLCDAMPVEQKLVADPLCMAGPMATVTDTTRRPSSMGLA